MAPKAKKDQVKKDQDEVFPEGGVPTEGAEAPAQPEAAAEAPVVELKKGEFPKSITAKPMFQVVQIGDQGRMYGKQGQPVSPIGPIAAISRLCSRTNAIDPEQLAEKGRKARS